MDISPDKAPQGYRLASNRQTISASDLVFYQGDSSRDARWERPRAGQNVIGATVHDLWPAVMALAVQ
jgi:hypothetical protein